MSLYRKYRPLSFADLDLVKVRENLLRIVGSETLPHALLFTGPRGAGKTSSARILARAINCENNRLKRGEPCNVCAACQEMIGGSALDVIEIDAASNRGIDDMRELKEKIRLSPVSLPYKVYIIDEVHMLSTDAFNALLKTLEEPPSQVIFVLCTTELHKVPETIVSRCVQVGFYKASEDELRRAFERVLAGEKRELDSEILSLICRYVDGSFRDGVKHLEQILSLGSAPTLEQVEALLSGGSGVLVGKWLSALASGQTATALAIFREVIAQGAEATNFLVQCMYALRLRILASYSLGESNLSISPEQAVQLIKAIDQVARGLGTAIDAEALVMALIIELTTVRDKVVPTGEPPASRGSTKPETTGKKVVPPPEAKVVTVTTKVENKEIMANYEDVIMDGATLRSLWRKMLGQIDKSQASLEALLAKASPRRVEGRQLIVGVAYDFHKTQLESNRFRAAVEDQVKTVFGMPLTIAYEVIKSEGGSLQTSVPSANMAQDEGDLSSFAEEIFVS